jgi:hypothetical protein
MQFLPFEEADTNAQAQAYVDAVGGLDKAVSWGAQGWQAALAFQTVVNKIVLDEGPNAITRASILEGLGALDNFTADGWLGAKSLRGASACGVVLKMEGGKFNRVFPEERGTFDCAKENLIEVTVEPVSVADQFT